MVGWEHSSRPLCGARPTASLNSGSPRSASQSSASSYPQAIANMRKRSIAGSVWTTSARPRHSRMQPASVSARPSRRSASRNSTSPPSDESNPPSKSALTFLRCAAGRSNGRRLSSVMAGVALSMLGKKDAVTTNFYPMTTTYATFAPKMSVLPRIMRARVSRRILHCLSPPSNSHCRQG